MNEATELDDILRALAWGPRDEALLRAAVPRLSPRVDAWVDAFYLRLTRDPTAVTVLGDAGRIMRLRRSLSAWFHEMMTLPVDAAYARAREEIGRTHVRIGMPQHLMVTAMHGLRRDVRADVFRIFGDDPGGAEATSEALEKALDLELALMLEAYRRRARELALRQDATVLAQAVARRSAEGVEDAVDAALCRTEGLRRLSPGDGALGRALPGVDEALREIGALARRWTARLPSFESEPRVASFAAMLQAAQANVSLPSGTAIERVVAPEGLAALVHVAAVQLALEELLQVAVNRDPGGTVRVTVRRRSDEGVDVEVAHGGARDPSYGVPEPSDGVGLAYGPIAAELHDGCLEVGCPGVGIRLTLRRARRAFSGTSDAHRPVGP